MSEPIVRTFQIGNQAGLHARAAALFVQCAAKFESQVLVEKDGEEVNGKSIMGIMMLAATSNSIITVKIDGSDAPVAMLAIADLIDRKFGEE